MAAEAPETQPSNADDALSTTKDHQMNDSQPQSNSNNSDNQSTDDNDKTSSIEETKTNTSNNTVPDKEKSDLERKKELKFKFFLQARFKMVRLMYIQKKMEEDPIPSELEAGLYLGSIGAAYNEKWLTENKITHILCVADSIDSKFADKITYKVIKIRDIPSEDLSAHFEECYKFIRSGLEYKYNNDKDSGKVLIHCFAGISRSVTVSAAYFCRHYNMKAVQALKLIKSKRTQANPNAGFIIQLIKWQHGLDKNSNNKNSNNNSTNNDNNSGNVDSDNQGDGLNSDINENKNTNQDINEKENVHDDDNENEKKNANGDESNIDESKTDDNDQETKNELSQAMLLMSSNSDTTQNENGKVESKDNDGQDVNTAHASYASMSNG